MKKKDRGGHDKDRGKTSRGESDKKSPGLLENLHPEARRWIGVIVLFTVGALSIFSVIGLAGTAGEWINATLGVLFGYTKILFPILAIGIGYVVLRQDRYHISPLHTLAAILLFATFNAFWHLPYTTEEAWDVVMEGRGGGMVGFFLSYSLQMILGFWGALVTLLALLVSSVVILFNTTLTRLFEGGYELPGILQGLSPLALFSKKKSVSTAAEEDALAEIPRFSLKETDIKQDAEPVIQEEEARTSSVEPKMEVLKPKRRAMAAQLSLQLLNSKRYEPTSGDLKKNKGIIEQTFRHFDIPVEMGEANIGPTVTQYTLKPAEGVRLERITALHKNLALALAAPGDIRIEAPIPGKALVGIEVPNPKTALVTLRELFETDEFKRRKNNLCIALGKDVSGKAYLPSLMSMPHLLIAGATGSGKSVCINTIINSLLFQNTPEELRFIMVDPKRVELPAYNDIPHLLTPVVTDTKKAINALKWTIGEMERRFEILAQHGKRDLTTFNKDVDEKLPYIVVIIDELADIMMTSAAEAENLIVRLSQMARAVGIHLILATQRPSVNVITGLIKANITSRIAFAVASGMDSRTILDTPGAERLVGKGDMLYLSAELSKPMRLQGVYVSEDEIGRVTSFLKESGEPSYEESVTEKQGGGAMGGGSDSDEDDDLLPQAKEVVIRDKKASASLLQRRLRVGYARAARLLDLLEAQGIIGPGDGAKPREVLIASPEELDMMDTEQGWRDDNG